jgi:Protein of unknown function (DUF4232)
VKYPSPRLALLAAALLMVLAGCGSKSDSTSGDTSGSSASGSSAAASPSDTSSSASSSPSSPAPCRTSGLKATLGPGEGAAGSTFFALHLKNISGKPCRTGGFGGVSLVAGPQGSPIGAPADRSQPGTVKQIVLGPGARATATLQMVTAENFSKSKCMPKQATGFRVYPPNETHSAFVANAATACASGSVHLLTLRPYQAG